LSKTVRFGGMRESIAVRAFWNANGTACWQKDGASRDMKCQ